MKTYWKSTNETLFIPVAGLKGQAAPPLGQVLLAKPMKREKKDFTTFNASESSQRLED
jgi:hypothetical protein